jgi:23S rRNA pseudouridine2605 synthase
MRKKYPEKKFFSKPEKKLPGAGIRRKRVDESVPKPDSVEPELMRLNKFIAHCGVCARRQAAEFVKNGDVTVNGSIELNPGYIVQPEDKISYKGKMLSIQERKVYILLNKPKDVITTASDEKGRKTVLDIVGKKVKERIFPVGRLDRMTTGLLLLTNDGDLAQKLSHPSHKVQKFYLVTLNKPVSAADLEKVRKGIELEDGIAQVDGIDYVGGDKSEIGVELHLGKNRIVRRIFEFLGYEVVRLDRTYYAGLTKKDIGRGHFRHLTQQEVIMLKHFK